MLSSINATPRPTSDSIYLRQTPHVPRHQGRMPCCHLPCPYALIQRLSTCVSYACYVTIGILCACRCAEWDRSEAFLPCYLAWCRVYAANIWTNYFIYITVGYWHELLNSWCINSSLFCPVTVLQPSHCCVCDCRVLCRWSWCGQLSTQWSLSTCWYDVTDEPLDKPYDTSCDLLHSTPVHYLFRRLSNNNILFDSRLHHCSLLHK